MNWLWVALGGMLGSDSRYGVTLLFSGLSTKPLLPYATIIVNISGCFAIGFLAAISHMKEGGLRPELRLFLMVGFLGGFTTYSSFGLEVFELIRNSHPLAAFLDVFSQLFFGLLAVGGGFFFAQLFI